MAAVTSALIAIAGVVLGWIAIELACKPCLEKGREAIDRSLDPDYDPDDDEISVPINPPNHDLQEQLNPRSRTMIPPSPRFLQQQQSRLSDSEFFL
ncbi:hypothetical protein OIU77_009193 [Salix suchowensis]|uniref:Outer envelope membrane protein 7 n=1 Tax=Salix suchowensis TaxID=1278906 RepID=A0ABQ9AEC4_9ROSI|nr:hypothetical protein OIU77_009193 [Salix suchowensis]